MSTGTVVTGLGTVGPHGVGPDALADGLARGAPALRPIDRSAGYHLEDSARCAGRVDPGALAPWLDAGAARRMSLPSRMAVAAARMAFEDADLDRTALAGRDVAVSIGTAFGPNAFCEKLLQQIRTTGPDTASPFLFMESVANAHAGQIALDSALRGPNATVVQREASALLAVAEGLAYVRSGSELALVGAVDEIAPMAHAALDRFGALSRSETGRAFDADRDGFVASEGATVLVLESEERAHARGAPIRARVEACVRANDPTASATDWGDGAVPLARRLRASLARAGLELGSIDRVVSGASGSRAGDRMEALLLRELYPEGDLPPVLAPKATTGEYGGGFLAAALLALGDTQLGPTPGFERVDPELGLRPHDGRALPPARRALVSCLASGGAAAWLVLGRP